MTQTILDKIKAYKLEDVAARPLEELVDDAGVAGDAAQLRTAVAGLPRVLAGPLAKLPGSIFVSLCKYASKPIRPAMVALAAQIPPSIFPTIHGSGGERVCHLSLSLERPVALIMRWHRSATQPVFDA